MKHSYVRTAVRYSLATLVASSLSSITLANEQLDPITVTANRMPSANVLASTTVITRGDIERLQITDLPELLSRQAGIDMTVNGGIGKASSLFMRGTNSDHALILVDGVKWHSATAGTTSIQDFPVEQIERIEIVHGPRSGLYGSEAIGGVIQIFTRQGKHGFNPYAKIAYGTHDSKQATLGINGATDTTSYNLSVNHQSTDGINARRENNPDKDGYRNNAFSAKIQHQLTDTVNIGANFLRADARNDYDGFVSSSDYYADSIQQVMGLNLDWHLTDSWRLAAQVSESRDESDNYTDGLPDGTFNTRYRFASVINTFTVNKNNTLNVGFDYGEDKVVSTTDYAVISRDNKALFLSWQADYGKQSWLISGRYDDNEAFGSHKTGTAEWGLWLQDNLQFSLNYGTGFKEPTFNDLYWPVGMFFQGNPDLKPEESHSFAMNLKGIHSWGDWKLNIYNTSIRNLIVYQFPQMENVDRASISGLEIEANTELAGWLVNFNASLLDPQDDATGNLLPRRAKRLANLNVDKQWGNWSIGASWKISAYRYDNAANTTRLGGFGVVDLRASYQMHKDWSVQATINNVFDKKYQTVNSYNSLDTVGMVTLSYAP